MKMRTKQEWDEYIEKINRTEAPEGWVFTAQHCNHKYRVYVSKNDPLIFYIWENRRFLFWTWYSPLFIFKAQ